MIMRECDLPEEWQTEITVDLFAGGGGASLGIEWATGFSPDVAVNHDPEALAMHKVNHPTCEHYVEDIRDVDPRAVCRGRRVGLVWASPDCKEHSRAKGGPIVRKKEIRCLPDVVIKWARAVRPRIFFVENVPELLKWGPLNKRGRIIKRREGEEFARWWSTMEHLGYKGERRIIKACDYGAPTYRARLFICFRCDGEPIVFPEPTHGPGRQFPYRTAADCINFGLATPSIFLTPEEAKTWAIENGWDSPPRRPLAEKTLKRIARGLKKYVLEAKRPFIVPVSHGDKGDNVRAPHDVNDPTRTVTGAHRGELALVQPFVASYYGESDDGGNNRASPADEPLRTQPTANRFAVVTPYIAGVGGRQGLSVERSVDRPYQTITTKADSVVVAPTLVRTAHGDVDRNGKQRGRGEHDIEGQLPTVCASGTDFAIVAHTMVQTGYGEREGQAPRALDIEKPLGTAVNGQKHALVSAFLAKHFGDRDGGWAGGADATKPFGAVTTRDHHSLVTSNLVKLRGTSDAHMDASSASAEDPVHTVSAGGTHIGEVRAFLAKYYGQSDAEGLGGPLGTLTTKERYGLVTVEGIDYQIVDIGMRMLTARELFRAQGFPDSYRIDDIWVEKTVTRWRGRKNSRRLVTKTIRYTLSTKAQVRMCGNSVCPDVAHKLVAANYVPQRYQVTTLPMAA